jgi:hypothetical protein
MSEKLSFDNTRRTTFEKTRFAGGGTETATSKAGTSKAEDVKGRRKICEAYW